MHFCRSKRHVWKHQEDAQKCCNGFKRVVVWGDNIPDQAENIQINEQTGMKFTRIWVEDHPGSTTGLF